MYPQPILFFSYSNKLITHHWKSMLNSMSKNFKYPNFGLIRSDPLNSPAYFLSLSNGCYAFINDTSFSHDIMLKQVNSLIILTIV